MKKLAKKPKIRPDLLWSSFKSKEIARLAQPREQIGIIRRPSHRERIRIKLSVILIQEYMTRGKPSIIMMGEFINNL